MNVLIIKGSPHEKGTTSLLAKKFEEGARAAGHVVQEIDAAHVDIKSCLGCNYCRKNNGICIHNDDMADAYTAPAPVVPPVTLGDPSGWQRVFMELPPRVPWPALTQTVFPFRSALPFL